jgi:glycosyltransferase involved in cell wall biosynthesis
MKILHLIDSLNPGGAERMAVAYVNALSQRGNEVYLWSTREEGILKDTLSTKVHYRFLNRKGPLGLKVLLKASKLIEAHKIQIIHAHSTSWFFGTLLKWLNPKVKLVWHDHYGNSEALYNRKTGVLKFCSRYFDLIFTVNRQLEIWAKKELNCKEVVYIKNFSSLENQLETSLKLKGEQGKRIVCLANFRAQKNHLNLLRAFLKIFSQHPDWTLHLLGKNWGDDCYNSIIEFLQEHQLEGNVFYYGSQSAISTILKQADIGILSSDSEGLPLAILEYAFSGLPVIATDVGYCSEVVGKFGKTVPPKNPEALAEALTFYINYPDKRVEDALQLNKHVLENYTEEAVMPEVLKIYSHLIAQ